VEQLGFGNILKSDNELPYDGQVSMHGRIFSSEKSYQYFNQLLSDIDWKHDEAFIHGKNLITKRKFSWYADKEYEYKYSSVIRKALIWNDFLLELKSTVEDHTGEKYNSCLLNLYHDGSEGMSWHSDSEKELQLNGSIASLSLGASRNFVLKHKKTNEKVSVPLSCGDLIEMKGNTQIHWLHSVPVTTKVNAPRINLKFRQMRT
jgi:alkylated DNA repair dioxygenase AlkB